MQMPRKRKKPTRIWGKKPHARAMDLSQELGSNSPRELLVEIRRASGPTACQILFEVVVKLVFFDNCASPGGLGQRSPRVIPAPFPFKFDSIPAEELFFIIWPPRRP